MPKRKRSVSRQSRWPGNLGIAVIDTLLVRILLPTGAVGFALFGNQLKWGLLHHVAWPYWIEALLAILVLDLAIYFQHRLFHGLPVLWRLHRMHHADLDVDVTTGNRFHPIEILLSMAIKFGVIIAVGAPAVSVLVFEVLLNGTSLFNHSNIRVHRWLEPLLRWMVVTPDMHRIHHSIIDTETNSNFGFNFPLWDRLFRTYRAEPAEGHQRMTLGLREFRDPEELRFLRLLAQPFRKSIPAPNQQPTPNKPAPFDAPTGL